MSLRRQDIIARSNDQLNSIIIQMNSQRQHKEAKFTGKLSKKTNLNHNGKSTESIKMQNFKSFGSKTLNETNFHKKKKRVATEYCD